MLAILVLAGVAAGATVKFTRPQSTTLLDLDGGALTVQSGPSPNTPRSAALRLFRAAVSKHRTVDRTHAYHGRVTIRPGVFDDVRGRPGWVITYRDTGWSACASSAPKASASPGSSQRFDPSKTLAFVLTDDRSVAVIYHGVGSGTCAPLAKPTARAAEERRSVAWTLVSRTDTRAKVRFTVPPCPLSEDSGFDGSADPPCDETLRIVVSVPIAVRDCPPPDSQTMTVHLVTPNAHLHHAPTVRTASTHTSPVATASGLCQDQPTRMPLEDRLSVIHFEPVPYSSIVVVRRSLAGCDPRPQSTWRAEPPPERGRASSCPSVCPLFGNDWAEPAIPGRGECRAG